MRRHFCIATAILIALLAVLLLLSLPVAASPDPSHLSLSGEEGLSTPPDYLLLLPLALPDPAEVPPGLTPEEADGYARHLVYRQAEPVLAELQHLRAEGLISGFEVRPDLRGIVVKGAVGLALERLSRLPGTVGGLAYTGEPPSCASAAGEALRALVLSLSGAPDGLSGPRAAGTAPQSSAPSIHIQLYPGGEATYLEGYTAPTTTVTLRIFRNGRLIATQSTSSTASGRYYFYPDGSFCFPSDWRLRPGDVVEVTAGGQTARTVVADLRAWIDPVANTVAGRTAPGRSVQVALTHYQTAPCGGTLLTTTVGTDPGGNFTATFSVDFDGRAWARVHALDSNGNSTYYYFYAYRIGTSLNSLYAWGYLKPEVDFRATLSRSGNIISMYEGRSYPSGSCQVSFTETIRSGDVISISGGGVTLQYTVVDIGVTIDPIADRITGTTGANRLVVASFSNYQRCSYSTSCQSYRTDNSGAFILAGMGLARMVVVYLLVYDDAGNVQSSYPVIPGLSIYQDWRSISGYWANPDAGYVTVTVRDSLGTILEEVSTTVSSYGYFYASLTALSPTNRIEVTDGALTETVVMPNLTARLDGDTGRLTGRAGPGRLVARLYDFRRERGPYSLLPYCLEFDLAHESLYTLTFSGAQVGGQDYARVQVINPDGHLIYGPYVYAFTVNAGENRVYGYTETPFAGVTLTLRRNNNPVAVITTTSWENGRYQVYLDPGTVITTGDVVEVHTNDGDYISIPVSLTAYVDGANNRIYGKAPANEQVQAEARRYGWGSYSSVSQNAVADGSGNYSASFDGLYWTQDCSSVRLGYCVQPAVYYYTPAGHQVWVVGPPPQPDDWPDAYEPDDTFAAARPYLGVQSHTFHAVTDTDWVSFTVPQTDVERGVPYRIETFNMGWFLPVRVILYDSKLNLQDEWQAYEYRGRGVSALWTPTAAGMYYLQIEPLGYYTTFCDAVYDLMILPVRAQIHLPLVMRNY